MPIKAVLCISVVTAFLLGAGMALGVTLSVPDTSGAPGDTVSVPILVDDATGIVGIEFILVYDAGVLTAAGAQLTPLTVDFHIQYGSQPGKIAVALASSRVIPGGLGSFVDVAFVVDPDASENATNPLELKKVALFDEEMEKILCSSVSGRFRVRDTTPPAAITDLAVSDSTRTTITLTWTASGDNGNTGTASQYDIRYSTSVLTEANWGSAENVADLPKPKTAGAAERLTVSGLQPETIYYFAIKAADEVPNWSALSNIVYGETAPLGREMVYNYPNPARGNETTFRYYLNGPAQVFIEIYDLSGDFVQELLREETAGGYGEILWDLSDIASGVYVYRFRASYPQTEVCLPVKKVLVIR